MQIGSMQFGSERECFFFLFTLASNASANKKYKEKQRFIVSWS